MHEKEFTVIDFFIPPRRREVRENVTRRPVTAKHFDPVLVTQNRMEILIPVFRSTNQTSS